MGALLGGPAFPLTHGTMKGKHRKKIKEEGELSILGLQYGFLFGGSVPGS